VKSILFIAPAIGWPQLAGLSGAVDQTVECLGGRSDVAQTAAAADQTVGMSGCVAGGWLG
jgi:hypothetical protein